MDHLHLTSDKLSVEAVSELVLDDTCGAVSVFVGTTRDNFEGRKVVRLEYEAYEDMALKALKNLCNDMRKKWPDVHGIAIYHRLGAVPSREASVVMAVSSPHRQASLAAVAHCIEQLKATVPIWKKEVYDGEASAWKQNKECVQTKHFLKLEPTVTPAETIDKNMIQVNVDNEGLRIRMENFMKMKRELVNLSNIHDFIPSKGQGSEADEDNSCARCRTVFVKCSDSKGHLKVRRVNNEWGPQTVRQPAGGGGAGGAGGGALPAGVEERVRDAERYLGVRSVQPDVYRRLKEMEDRIRHLEAVSPEYAQFWRNNSPKSPGADERTAKMDCRFTADEIDRKIEQLEKQNSSMNVHSGY